MANADGVSSIAPHANAPYVFVVDDEPVAAAFAASAARSLDLPVRQFPSAEALLNVITEHDRGCLVLDLQLEGMTGLELQLELNQRNVCLPVIVVSGHGNVSKAVLAMKQHAFDFFEKPVESDSLADSIRRAVEVDAQRAVGRVSHDQIRRRYAILSPRERQVMAAVVEGLANKQIAAKFELSEKTIEVHRGNVMRKMAVESVAALVKAAMACNPTPDPAHGGLSNPRQESTDAPKRSAD